MNTTKTNHRKNLNDILRKNRIIDSLIYTLSGRTAIYETLQYRIWLLTKKSRYISDFNPIVIGGCPRSGTTLARALISIHPDIASPEPEYNVLMWIKNKEILQNVMDFSSTEINELKNRWKDTISFAEHILRLYMEKQGKQYIAVKHPLHILIIDDLFRYFPNMKFIHIIRDGRDTVCSLRTHPKRKIVDGVIMPTNIINPFRWCIRRWIVCINQGKKWRESKNYREIKYEDLVTNTVDTMRDIFQFVDVKMIPKEDLLDFYKYENAKKHLQNIEVGRSIYEKSIGRWRKDMNINEKKLFKDMAGELLLQYGYEDSLNW